MGRVFSQRRLLRQYIKLLPENGEAIRPDFDAVRTHVGTTLINREAVFTEGRGPTERYRSGTV